MSDTTVTLIDSRIVHAGCEEAFHAWAERVGTAAEAQPGFRGGLRIAQTGGLFHLVHRFADAGALAAWERSEICCRLQDEALPFSTPRRETATGVLPWIKLPSDNDAPKWKRFLMTWGAVLPVALATNVALDASPVDLPGPVQSVIASLILIAAMTWFVLPRLSRWLKPWVLEDSEGKARVEG